MVFQAEMHPVALDLASAATHTSTVTGTAGGLSAIPSDATHALLSIETASLRFLDTGATATATNGHRLAADTFFWISGRQRLLDWSMIRDTGTSATVQVTYYKYSDTA